MLEEVRQWNQQRHLLWHNAGFLKKYLTHTSSTYVEAPSRIYPTHLSVTHNRVQPGPERTSGD